MSGIPVTPQAYGEIVDALDEIVDHLKREYSKSEEEVQAWLEGFIQNHYWFGAE